MELLIYLAYLYPIIAAILLYFGARTKTAWWEYFLPFAISTILIFGFKVAGEKSQTTDVEYWGSAAQSATYIEDWNERVSCRHTKYCTRSVSKSDGKGGTKSSTERYACGTEHSYDVDYHPPKWTLTDSTDTQLPISQQYFEHLAQYWKNRKFKELHRRYHSNDGDRYDTVYDDVEDHLVPVTTKHSYENRVIASNSAYKHKTITEEEARKKGLFAYPQPDGDYKIDTVLGDVGDQKSEGEKLVNRLNSIYGPLHQVRVWLIVFKNKPLEISHDQEAYWQGGNKNELTLCIGVDDNRQIKWARPFFWKPDDAKSKDRMNMLAIELRDWMNAQSGQKLDVKKISSKLKEELPKNWKRKKFEEFNYLRVQPPTWAVALTHLLTFLSCIGVGYWVVTNEYDESTP